MLPLAHTYVSTKAANKTSPQLIIGGVLPDIATTSTQQIGRNLIHNSPDEFYNFILSNYPVLTDLGLGVRLHSDINGGADYYTDDRTVGYAYINGKEISTDVAELLNIPNEEASLVLAHNFIELAIDLHLYSNNHKIYDTFKNGILDSKNELPLISQCLSEYLKLDQSLITKDIDRIILFLDSQYLLSPAMSSELFILPLIKLRYKKEASKEKAEEILNKALEITKLSYQTFLDQTVTEVRKNILG